MTVLRTAVEIDCALSACVPLQAQNMFHRSLCIPSRRTIYNIYNPVWLISSELSAFNLPLESWGVPQGCSLILVMFVLTLLFGKIHSGLIISVISSRLAAVRVPFAVWNSANTNPVTCYYSTYMRMFLVFYNLWWWSAQKCSSPKCSLTCDTHETVNSHVHTYHVSSNLFMDNYQNVQYVHWRLRNSFFSIQGLKGVEIKMCLRPVGEMYTIFPCSPGRSTSSRASRVLGFNEFLHKGRCLLTHQSLYVYQYTQILQLNRQFCVLSLSLKKNY